VLVPYELTFRSFSSELAEVLSRFASSPNGLIVRAVNVEPASSGAQSSGDPGAGFAGSPYDAAAGNRYSNNQYGGEAGGAYPAAGYGYPAARPRTVARGGLPTMLDEKQFKVTLLVQVVRLNLTPTE